MDKKALQEDLRDLGYYKGRIDGSIGPLTKYSIKKFQSVSGLTPDGSPGPLTRRELLEARYGIKQEWLDKQTLVIKIPKKTMMFDVIDCEGLMSVYSMQKKYTAPIMCNGGLFGMKSGIDLNYMIDNGRVKTRGVFSKYALARMKDGSQQIRGMVYHENMNNIDNFVEAIGASPTLVIDGEINIDKSGLEKDSNFLDRRHPRIGIGYDDDYFYLVVVHGRRFSIGHRGVTIKEFSIIFKKLKVKGAINLDGGGSIGVYDRYLKPLNRMLGIRRVGNVIRWIVK